MIEEVTDPELASMKDYLEREAILIQDAGVYPLITYCGPNSQEAMNILRDNGQHLRACAVAARQGMPFSKWPLMLLNLDDPRDLDILKSAAWQQEWNGLWIHQSHGAPGYCLIDKLQNDGTILPVQEIGVSFYSKYGKFVMQSQKFRSGVINCCNAATGLNGQTNSFIEQLQKVAKIYLKKPIKLCGADASTWVPLYGAHYGKMLIVLEPFLQSCDGQQRVATYYFTGGFLERMLGGEKFISRENELRYVSALTENYYREAIFNPDREVPLGQQADTANKSTFWYYTG